MKRTLLVLVCSLWTTTGAFAQESTGPVSHGYAFFAPGVSSPGGSGLAHFGAGGEGLIRRFGIGGEVGYVTPWRSFGDGLGVASANGSYHFGSGKVLPFVTGGYSLFFRSGTANGFNYGGGVNYWFRPRQGLRFEVRDNVMAEYGNAHLVGFRVGLTFH